MNLKNVLSFDDVLIVPKFSKIQSRDEIDLSVNFYGKLLLPIISSNNETITESTMANKLHDVGANNLDEFKDVAQFVTINKLNKVESGLYNK